MPQEKLARIKNRKRDDDEGETVAWEEEKDGRGKHEETFTEKRKYYLRQK